MYLLGTSPHILNLSIVDNVFFCKKQVFSIPLQKPKLQLGQCELITLKEFLFLNPNFILNFVHTRNPKGIQRTQKQEFALSKIANVKKMYMTDTWKNVCKEVKCNYPYRY
jgi:hypothetical protein